MARTHQIALKKALLLVAALVLVFGPFVMAKGESGIFFGTIIPGAPATPGTPGSPAIPGAPAVLGSSGVPPAFNIPTVDTFDTITFNGYEGYPGYPGYQGSPTIPAIPAIPAILPIPSFSVAGDDGELFIQDEVGFSGYDDYPGYPGYLGSPINPAIPVIPVIPPISEIPPIPLDTDASVLRNFSGIPSIPAIPAIAEISAIPEIPGTPGTPGTSTDVLSPGQEFARENISQLCAQDNSVACLLSAGIDGITAQNLSPQAGIQAETIAITSPYQFIRNNNEGILQLIRNRRVSSKKSPQQSFLLNSSASLTGAPAVSGAGFIGPLGISVNSSGSFGDRNNAEGQTGFQLNTQQANLMIDYSFNQKLIGGFSFEYLGADRNLSLASGNLNSDSYRFAPFLLVRPTTSSYITLMGGYALVNYDSTRTVSSSSGITFNNATANYNADQFFASLGGGYIFTLKDGWNLRGYGRGDFSNISIQSFQEKGGVASDGTNNLSLAMQMNGQTIRSVTSTLGAELSHVISTKTFIPVLIPRLRAEWVHEFANDGRAVRAGFIDQNGFHTTSGLMGVAGPERNWANLGFGVQMLFARSIVGYINYDRLIIQHANNNIISGGIRINF